MRIERSILVPVGAVTVVQALLFFDYHELSLTVLAGIGLGIWLRNWTAGLWAAASFLVAFLLAAGTGWLSAFRLVDPVLGLGLALLSGLITGGIFDVVRAERPVEQETERRAT